MNAPKVTPEQVNEAIVGETYTVLPDGRTTICQLTLKNGFTVDGHSAVVSKENFNKKIGEEISYGQAKEKIWAYLGWDLANKVSLLKGAGEATGFMTKIGVPTTYVGTKVVRALPMNRKGYNDLRGWDLPKEENPLDEGYLVEYVDGGFPNVKGFTGYISWSPKDVFEKAYTTGQKVEGTSFLDRLLTEYDQLNERFKKLSSFLGSEQFNKLAEVDRDDLHDQQKLMHQYLGVLNRRIQRHR